jgi:hypothetical protein
MMSDTALCWFASGYWSKLDSYEDTGVAGPLHAELLRLSRNYLACTLTWRTSG